MILSTATAPDCVDTCNLSAANTYYTGYDDLGPTAFGTWASYDNLSTAIKHFRSKNNLGSTAIHAFPWHDDLINHHTKLAHQ